MDLQLLNKGIIYAQKRKKRFLLITALGFTTYGAYKVCNSPSAIRKSGRVFKILSALASITEFVGDSAETIGVISKDLKEFVKSDSDQLPTSIKQVFKITKSDEFSDSIVRVTKALTVGVLHGYWAENVKSNSGGSGFSDRALDKLLSPAGSGFASVIVGSFSRNMVLAMYAERGRNMGESGQKWVDVITDDKCRVLIGDYIQRFASPMVTIYLDKTMDANPYDDILSSLTNPKHEDKVRDLLALVCNGAIETFIRTSHQVLTNSRSSSSSVLTRKSSSTISKVLDGQELVLSKLKAGYLTGNMSFVFDVMGRVTVASIKSFLGFSFNKICEGIKRNCNEAYRYLSAKSLVVMTICVSLYLHMLNGPWSMVTV